MPNHVFNKSVKEGEIIRCHALHIPFGHIAREGLPMGMHKFVRVAIEHQPRSTSRDPAYHPLHHRQAEYPERSHVDGKQER